MKSPTIRLEEKITETAEQLHKFSRLLFLRRKTKLTKAEVKEVFDLLCYENFAGCCAPRKGCPYHLLACELLGINPNELYDAKKKAVEEFLKNQGVAVP